MSQTLSFNPVITTNAPGSFNISSTGYIQGTMLDDPAIRNTLAGGVLASSETLPMWGGVGIYELTPTTVLGGTQGVMGGNVGRATTLTATSATGLTGFSVLNQAHHMITTPQSPVPVSLAGMSVHFARLGSGARVAVAIDPSLVSLEGNIINQQVSWDFTNQRLQPYVASGATESITSMTWSSTNGGQVAVVMASASVYGLGDTINISGATNSGTAGNSAVNGNFVINTWTNSTNFTFLLPGTSTTIGTIGGTMVINVGTGALACKIIDVQIGNCMTVAYNATTGYVSWNRSGSAAIILI
jgi:hypothetical protein